MTTGHRNGDVAVGALLAGCLIGIGATLWHLRVVNGVEATITGLLGIILSAAWLFDSRFSKHDDHN